VEATTAQGQSVLLRIRNQLDKGAKALVTRQKFIKIADRSEFGWATVKYYQSNPLASDSNDEKDLGRAEKDAWRDAERQAGKRRCARQPVTSKRPRRSQWSEQGTSTNGEGAPVMRPVRQAPASSGPCWRCGAYGHLATSCTATK